MPVDLERQAQIRALIFNKAPTEVLVEYSDYSDVFLAENVAELLKNTGINKHVIELEEGKQLIFGPIYGLNPVELKTLKTYIEINLASNFIHLFRSPAGAPILFNKKPNKGFFLCVDYWGFNNITIKNQYLLLFIRESLD